ncbi:hypothetical protein TSOC_009898 [Tetrabaena socialis]|uniref:Uncharacterized protein n=1 Tax=Tetrabaena socialis TaxID=47790 RepID=A0A2J7ZUP4_9CHLO|nr:hypothetical protein TSOC_009898 [Tetrabaena socialis]|eukprot:PNH03995.1 hypothetical protein TSOC_009898 [Tetrabaena socialis]
MGSGELACSVCGVTSTSLRKRKPSSRLVAVPAEAIVLVASPSERAGAAQSAAAGCQLSGLCQVHYAANVRAQAEALKAREAAANKRKTRAQGAAQDQGAAEPEWLQQALVRLLAEQAAKQSAAPALGGGASTADELLAPPVRTTRAAARVLAVAGGALRDSQWSDGLWVVEAADLGGCADGGDGGTTSSGGSSGPPPPAGGVGYSQFVAGKIARSCNVLGLRRDRSIRSFHSMRTK